MNVLQSTLLKNEVGVVGPVLVLGRPRHAVLLRF